MVAQTDTPRDEMCKQARSTCTIAQTANGSATLGIYARPRRDPKPESRPRSQQPIPLRCPPFRSRQVPSAPAAAAPTLNAPEKGANGSQPTIRGRLATRDTLSSVNDPRIELSARLNAAAQRLRAGELEPEAAMTVIDECARLASEASALVDERSRAALEPLPDLPGQLPLPAA
jgi:hypothetical protein